MAKKLKKKTEKDFKQLLTLVDFKGLEFIVTSQQDIQRGNQFFLHVHCPGGIDNVTGNLLAWNGRKWRISPWMTDTEVVATAFKAVLTATEHEVREKFLFKGKAVYDSHISVYKLAELRGDEANLDARGEHKA